MKLTAGTGTAKKIAICCLHSAKMLEIADADIPDIEKRNRVQELNRKQAELLRECAAILNPRYRCKASRKGAWLCVF